MANTEAAATEAQRASPPTTGRTGPANAGSAARPDAAGRQQIERAVDQEGVGLAVRPASAR